MTIATVVAHWTNGKETIKLFKQGKEFYTRYAHMPNQYAEAVFIDPRPKSKDKAIQVAQLRANQLRRIL